MGTVGYMSPEQAKGQPVDFRTDQFSLGAILYEMATGKRAFQRESSVQTLSAIIEQEPDAVGSVPERIRAIVERCLAKSPEDRYGSTRDLARDLKDIEVSPSQAPAPRVKRRRVWPAVVGGLVAVLAFLLLLNTGGLREWLLGGASSQPIESIAVLPLENLSGDPEQEYFADGMTEALTAELGQWGGVRVISRTSVMVYKDARKPLPEIARELNVDAVVEGSVLRSDDRVRITAQLVRVSPEEHLWAHNYERHYGEVLALQSEIALAVAREIQGTLSPATENRFTRTREVDPEAYEDYLKGRYYLNQRTPEALTRSREYFQQATEKDPTYAPAYAGLAEYYGVRTFYSGLPPKEWFPLARAAADKALELDDDLAEAQAVLGIVYSNFDYNWSEAERELERAVELNPNYVTGHVWYAFHLAVRLGRVDEAVRQLDRALEIDPFSRAGAAGGLYLFSIREYDRALSYVEKTLKVDPDYPVAQWVRGLIYAQKGSLSVAVAEFEEALRGGLGTMAIADLGRVYALMGRTDEARGMLDQLLHPPGQTYASPFHVALVYIGLGDRDQALQWLEKAYEDRSPLMSYSRADPRLDPLRDDPRFQDLMRRMNFPGSGVKS
jgi:TolB-like protein/Tfp pilus assembly protein PilF